MIASDLSTVLAPYEDGLIALRRDVHAHPELSRAEKRTTALVADRLQAAGVEPMLLPGTGLLADIGRSGPLVAVRADLDALPLADRCTDPWRSTVDGVAHACGHDVHVTAALGAGLVLADLARAGRLPGRVRLIFQPAEEVQPGGAQDVINAGGLDDVERAYALHGYPRTDVGRVGVRVGPITSASDQVLVRLRGSGGHTSRPHLTEDLVYALGQVIVGVPGVLSRRLDPRAGTAMVWGRVSAGSAPNAIPTSGEVHGTLRCMDSQIWRQAGALLTDVVADIVRPYGVRAQVIYTRGVPPTVNDAEAVGFIRQAALAEVGEAGLMPTEQSLGGEDFAWMLEKVPGAMFRLGTRTPGGRTFDLHQGDFAPDERAIAVGARMLAATVLADLGSREMPSRP